MGLRQGRGLVPFDFFFAFSSAVAASLFQYEQCAKRLGPRLNTTKTGSERQHRCASGCHLALALKRSRLHFAGAGGK